MGPWYHQRQIFWVNEIEVQIYEQIRFRHKHQNENCTR